MLTWKEAARHFWSGRRLAEKRMVSLEIRLVDERQKRTSLINTLSDILMDIAYDDDDLNQEWCNVCHRNLIEENGHAPGCLYILGLAALAEAARSAN